jgi:hypothetical protein
VVFPEVLITGAPLPELLRTTVLATAFAEGRPKLQFSESAHASLAAPVQTVSTFVDESAEKPRPASAKESKGTVNINLILEL